MPESVFSKFSIITNDKLASLRVVESIALGLLRVLNKNNLSEHPA